MATGFPVPPLQALGGSPERLGSQRATGAAHLGCSGMSVAGGRRHAGSAGGAGAGSPQETPAE